MADLAGRHAIVLPGSDTISFSTSSPSNSMYSGKIASAAMSRGPRLSIGKGGSPRLVGRLCCVSSSDTHRRMVVPSGIPFIGVN